MERDDRQTEVDEIDIRTLSVDDVRRLNNPVLREALLAAKRQVSEGLSATHVKHLEHSEHTKMMF